MVSPSTRDMEAHRGRNSHMIRASVRVHANIVRRRRADIAGAEQPVYSSPGAFLGAIGEDDTGGLTIRQKLVRVHFEIMRSTRMRTRRCV